MVLGMLQVVSEHTLGASHVGTNFMLRLNELAPA